MYSASQNGSIDVAKLLQLKRDLEALQPGQGRIAGPQETIEVLKPVVQDALQRGCSVQAIMGLLQSYRLEISSRDLGINKPF